MDARKILKIASDYERFCERKVILRRKIGRGLCER